MTKGSGLTKLQYGMSGINVHFLFLIRPKEIKVRCGQRRQSNCGLQSHAEKKRNNNQRFHTVLHSSSRRMWCALEKHHELGRLKSLNV
jgi:hypothetical protein